MIETGIIHWSSFGIYNKEIPKEKYDQTNSINTKEKDNLVKGYSIKHKCWIESTKRKDRNIWINKLYINECYNRKLPIKRFRSKKKPYLIMETKLPPVILSLQELKENYENKWLIPVHPEIVCRYENKIYEFSRLKEIW